MKGAFRREEVHLVAVALLAALLVASSNTSQTAGLPLWGVYPYWLVRIGIEAVLFVALRDGIERHLPRIRSLAGVTAAAMLASLVPFVLAVTALDIVLGQPELGLDTGQVPAGLRLAEFAMELVYLLDNHLALCLLLTIPRVVLRTAAAPAAEMSTAGPEGGAADGAVLRGIDPPLAGEVIWAEAQEHYVRLVTPSEARLVLHRFSDILRALPADAGVRVHRSHWVAFAAIAEAFRDGANLRLRLRNGAVVPVSRSYRGATERALESRRIVPAAAGTSK